MAALLAAAPCVAGTAVAQDKPLPPPRAAPSPPRKAPPRAPQIEPERHQGDASGEATREATKDGDGDPDEAPRVIIAPAAPDEENAPEGAESAEGAEGSPPIEPHDPSGASCPAELEEATCAALARGEDERVGALLASLKGASLRQRIIAYEAYVRAHPKSRHAAVLYEEAAELRKWLDRRVESDGPPRRGSRPRALSFSPPRFAQPGMPLDVAIEIEGEVAAIDLYLRGADGTYRAAPMRRLGSNHFGYTFSAEEMREPGVRFYVEAVLADGTSRRLAGDRDHPYTVVVDEPISVAAPRVEAGAIGDYLDYDRMRGDDWLWRLDGDLGLRFGPTGLRAIRGGFTVARGEILVAGAPNAVGLTTGHLELEAGLHEWFGLVLRAIGGATETDPLTRHATGGGRLMARIGPDDGVNALLGTEYIAGWGARGIGQLDVPLIDSVPLGAALEIGDQPLGELTYRGTLQVGYRPVDEFTISARVSYQGRDGGDGGPGFGAGARARW